VVAGLLAFLALGAAPAGETALRYFFGDGCPYCEQQAVFLDDLERRFPALEVQRFEVWHDADNRNLLTETLAGFGETPQGVPVTVFGGSVWTGFNDIIAADIERAVATASAGDGRTPSVPGAPDAVAGPPPPADRTLIDVPVLGEVDLGGRSLVAATGLIAFVDGFNPCSLWVLTVLLAMVINAGTGRGRLVVVGVTFLTVTAAVYGLFVAGLFSVMGAVGMVRWVAVATGLLAVAYGAVNVKDYLFYKRGVSFTIPDRFKPWIFRRGRAIRDGRRSLAAVTGLTAAMALGVSLLELPCTAGLPVVWTGLLRANEVAGAEFVGLLGVYLLVYLLDELVLFTVVVTTMRLARFEQRHGRVLKLVGGVVMVVLGGVLIVAPGVMGGLGGAVGVMAGAGLLAAVLLVVHRRILPHYGIRIGDETAPAADTTPKGQAMARAGRQARDN
jgi:hypothetical protein